MRLFPALIAATACLSALAAEPEWKPLFDGKSTEGWIQRGGKAKYTVEDGCIVGTSVAGTPNSFLCPPDDYANFVLEYEYKVDPELNSGVQFRSLSLPEYHNGQVHGYQCEIDNDPKKARFWAAGIYEEGARGWLCPMKDDKEAGKAFTEQGAKITKVADWNKVRIEARGSDIKTFFNGEPRATLKDDKTARGFIGFQVHGIGNDKSHEGKQVRWRNLRIRSPGRRAGGTSSGFAFAPASRGVGVSARAQAQATPTGRHLRPRKPITFP
ncbi:MAG: DUF1080 domain-containing protein [Kiritimatiellia bacterium]